MKLYDLRLFLFFSFFVKFQKGFLRCQEIAKLLVAVEFKGCLRVVRTPGCCTTILTFSLFFSTLVCRFYSHPYRLSNNLRSDIIEIISLEHQVERWRGVFLYVLIYRLVPGFTKLSSLTAGLWTVPTFRPYIIKKMIKQCTRGGSPCLSLC